MDHLTGPIVARLMCRASQRFAIAVLLFATTCGAIADHGSRYQEHRDRRDNAAWVVPLLVLGMTVVAANTNPTVQRLPALGYPPVPVSYLNADSHVVQIPPPPPIAGRTFYFCRSARLYHPYTLQCPEGWLQVVGGQRY